jgi:hypothetical protein
MTKRSEIIAIVKDRLVLVSLLFCILLALIITLVTLLRLSPSDVQIPIRYTDYGTANIYRNQWFALYVFPFFALLITAINVYISTKIHKLNRLVCLSFIGMTIFILVTCLIVTNSILNLAPTI